MGNEPPIKESDIRESLVQRADAMNQEYLKDYLYVKNAPDGQLASRKAEVHTRLLDDLLVPPSVLKGGGAPETYQRRFAPSEGNTYCAGLISVVMTDLCDQNGLKHDDSFHQVSSNEMINLMQEQGQIKMIASSGVSFHGNEGDQGTLHTTASQENFDISMMNLPKPGDIAFQVFDIDNDQLRAKHVFMFTDVHVREDGTVHVERLDAGSKAPHVSKRDFASVEDFQMHYNGVGFVDTVDVIQEMNQGTQIVRDVAEPELPNSPEVLAAMAKENFADVTTTMHNYNQSTLTSSDPNYDVASYELISNEEIDAANEHLDQEIDRLMADGVFSQDDKAKLNDSVKKMATEALNGDLTQTVSFNNPENQNHTGPETQTPQMIVMPEMAGVARESTMINIPSLAAFGIEATDVAGYMPEGGPNVAAQQTHGISQNQR